MVASRNAGTVASAPATVRFEAGLTFQPTTTAMQTCSSSSAQRAGAAPRSLR